MITAALVFDLDGVVLDSEHVKINTFADLFIDEPLHLPEIQAYNGKHRGVPRETKFRYICENILNLKNPEKRIELLLSAYKERLRKTLKDVQLVPGVKEFILTKNKELCFIASSAPHEEITQSLSRHDMLTSFMKLYGFPYKKADVLRDLKGTLSEPIVFFGDAQADYEAAQSAETAFVAVSEKASLRDPAGMLLPSIPHFLDNDLVEHVIELALKGQQICRNSELAGKNSVGNGVELRCGIAPKMVRNQGDRNGEHTEEA